MTLIIRCCTRVTAPLLAALTHALAAGAAFVEFFRLINYRVSLPSQNNLDTTSVGSNFTIRVSGSIGRDS